MSEMDTVGMETQEGSSTVDNVKDRAQGMTEQARVKAREQIDQRSTQVGEQTTMMVGRLREVSDNLRNEDQTTQADALDRVTDQVQRIGDYLTGADADRMMREIEDFGRRRPWLLGAAGFLTGLMIARFLKASSERRSEEWQQPNFQERLDRPPSPYAEPTAPPLSEPVPPVEEPVVVQRDGV